MLSSIRRDYQRGGFDRAHLSLTPYELFQRWFGEALSLGRGEPNAMSLATVDALGQPSCRIVLLKEVSEAGFTFFTNYHSHKGHDLESNNRVAATFFWSELERQVRIEGHVEKISEELSDRYFLSRPTDSQVSAMVSPQSSDISDLESIRLLAQKLREGTEPLVRPENWGGYLIVPNKVEFWQGGANRLHTRYEYFLENGKWKVRQLAP